MSTQENPLNDVVIELNEKPQPRRRRKKKKKVTKEPEDDFATRRENYLQLHNFTSKIKTKQEISDMKKGVKSFYGHQNSIIESFENLFKPEKGKDNSIGEYIAQVYCVKLTSLKTKPLELGLEYMPRLLSMCS